MIDAFGPVSRRVPAVRAATRNAAVGCGSAVQCRCRTAQIARTSYCQAAKLAHVDRISWVYTRATLVMRRLIRRAYRNGVRIARDRAATALLNTCRSINQVTQGNAGIARRAVLPEP